MQTTQIIYKLSNNSFLIMRTGNQSKGLAFIINLNLFFLAEQAEPRNEKIIERKEYNQYLQRNHDYIKIRIHQPTPSLPKALLAFTYFCPLLHDIHG